MSDTLEFLHDHDVIAWEHTLAQHIGKRRTENFFKAFYQPLNELDRALNQLYTRRWIEEAVGKQLDGCGSIVGITRDVPNSVFLEFFGFASQISGRTFSAARMRRKFDPWSTSQTLGDVEFRALIHLKIALDNGHGTAEEIMLAFDQTLSTTRTRVMDAGNATAKVYINDFIMSFDPRSTMLNYMIPRAAGVKFWLHYVDVDNTFGFENQAMDYKGFGEGILARWPESNIPPITVSMSVWDRGDSQWDDGQSVWDLKGYRDDEDAISY